MKKTKNTGHLLSVYCPECKKVTDKISFNLLREAGKVQVSCPVCHNITFIEYNGKMASIYHQDDALQRVWEEMSPAGQKNFKTFVQGKKK